MSQRLPTLPNLDHLKKQAKDVLRVSRHRSPRWRLADAQHALARGYGFPSWPELKLHVQSVRQQHRAASRLFPERENTTARNADEAPRTAAQNRPSRQTHPIAGTWAARPAAGHGDRQAPFGNVVVDFEVTDDIVTLTQIAADPAGRETAVKMVIQVDGQDHPIQFGSELVLQAKWNVGTLETIVKQGEQVVSKGTYEVSADGNSLVVSTGEQLVAFERV